MGEYITELNVSINASEEEELVAQGFQKINVDLNRGAGGNYIYLWYKTGKEGAITRVQATFTKDMDIGLIRQGYTEIEKDLNAGSGGNQIYVWYFRGSTEYDIPIVNIDVTNNADAEASKFTQGWQRVGCDLNRNVGGDWVHMWVKREKQTYICDVAATDSFGVDADYFGQGYIRMDEDTNRGAGGHYIFTWYRLTTDPKKAIDLLEVSTTHDEYQRFQWQGYTVVPVNLNGATGGNLVYMWYKRDEIHDPVKVATILLNPDNLEPFTQAGVKVIQGNLNAGNSGIPMFLCYHA